MTEIDTEPLIEALQRPEAYPHPVGAGVEMLQTHISYLFFAGDRVYKVKKPVDLGFLDYTTLERRRHFTEEEVRLNRRLSPKTYLGIAPIRHELGGIHVGKPTEAVGRDDKIIEYAVAMQRLPAARMMNALLDEHAIDNDQLNALADKLATFHAQVPTGEGIDEHGSPKAIAANVLENFEQTRPAVGSAVSTKLHAHLEERAQQDLRWLRERFEQRVAAGRIRDGHGDLHTGNVCFIDRDHIVIYDCIEFSPRLRCGDVACDLAFLTMDLDHRRLRGFSGYLAKRYAERAEDPELLDLEPFYKIYRAMVRAKVACFKSAGTGVPEDERHAARLEAMSYFHLAASYTLPPALILVCGLPASGKSYAIEHLTMPFEASVLSSDRIRKRLAGVPETHHAGGEVDAGIYTQEMSERTYATLLEEAEQHLEDGWPVLLDATFSSRARRAPFLELAERRGLPILAVHLDPPDDVIRERLEGRLQDAQAISDADVSVYEAMRSRWEPLDELPRVIHWPHVDRPLEELTAALIDQWLG